MIYIFSFIALVGLIGLITNKINAVPACQHDWQAKDQAFKCCKCNKEIPDYTDVYQESTFNEQLGEVA